MGIPQFYLYVDWVMVVTVVGSVLILLIMIYHYPIIGLKKGNYAIKAKTKDNYGLESNWSTLEVNMPKTNIYNQIKQLLLRMLERFPFFEKY